MKAHFHLTQYRDWIQIQQKSPIKFHYYHVYVNHQLVATFFQGNTFYVKLPNLYQNNLVIVVGGSISNGMIIPIAEQYTLPASVREGSRQRNFKPGDILVASDNVFQELTGYMGHAALVVDENKVIESPGLHPSLRKDTIQQFLEKHPIHAQFRPKKEGMGEAAASYAMEYLASYKANLEQGENKPVFSFNLSQSLEDPWEYIYCSKLIWLSYYYGADYKLENDHLWYSPEDLYTELKENEEFETVYAHEDVEFKLNT
ncbi:hypothetical protein NC661_11095 [Aquibacillus koreensis]|uniref:Uncharacterized protein n=2 Tax=Aquibacillus koreensis TaxID=279446 RepID=A0A9X3WP74_9BACI|nr:hypothetical protein [Aquibacillus koreensis]MCT2538142.1 hypothetical protein [Aquibacillus koreensis]MDC3420914.1 hypothetical protein [Aquibacillus koreensis]